MNIQSSNNAKEKTLSKDLKIEKENTICKDGFCTLQNQNASPTIVENNEVLFDPI